MKFKSDIEVQAGIKDSAGNPGTTGQVLSSNGTTVSWIDGDSDTAHTVLNQVKAGVAISKGQAVYVTSADGTNIIVGLASNTSEATSSKTLGLLDATVATNNFANVVQIGRLAGLNTIGATVGDPVWLGANGNLVYGLVNKPYAPLHLVFIGVVTRVNSNNGEIFINVQNGFELDELHNVSARNPVDNDLLAYTGASVNLWETKSLGTIIGGTSSQFVKGDGSLDSNLYVTLGTVQTITGQKTFSGDIIMNSSVILNQSSSGSLVPGYTTILGGAKGIQIYDGISSKSVSLKLTNITAARSFEFPDKSGTFALIDDFNGFVTLDTAQTITGTKTFTSNLLLNAAAISGRESLLVGSVSDNSTDKFILANGTTTASRFIPTFVGYTQGEYQSLLFRGLGSATYDVSTTPPYIQFLAANTSSSTDPNNGTLSAPTARDLFSWSTTGGTDFMKIAASGNVLIGSAADAGYKLDVNGNFSSNNIYLKSTASIIGTNTTDGSDNKSLRLTSTDVVSSDRGAFISLFGNESSATGRIQLISGNVSNGSIEFYTGATTERMRITSGGDVGIGVTTPPARLSVQQITANSEYARLGTSSLQDRWLSFSTFAVGGSNSVGHLINSLFSTGALAFGVNGERMRITSGGNVGIGTTSPAQNLHVVGNGLVEGVILYRNGSTNILNIGGDQNMYGGTNSDGGVFVYGNNKLHLSTNSVRRLTVDGSGNVGIGTTTPATKLHLLASAENEIRVQESTNNAYVSLSQQATTSYIIAGRTGATPTQALSIYTGGSERMRISQTGKVGIGTTNPQSQFVVSNGATGFEIDSTGTPSLLSYNRTLSTYQELSFAASSYYFNIGNVGIGTANPTYKLHLFTDSAAKPTSALWTIASDERIKENINSYTKGLNELLKINPITYDYNGLGGFKKGKGGVGIIAQEIAEILPDSVSSIKAKLNETDEEEVDILNFNGHELTYILINAVKELKAEIEILKNK